MIIRLTTTERDTLLEWRNSAIIASGHFGGGEAHFPEEEALSEQLAHHQDGDFDLSYQGAVILLSWAESSVDPNFGSGAITNPVEQPLLSKLKRVYAQLSSDEAANSSTSRMDTFANLTSEKKQGTPKNGKHGRYIFIGAIPLMALIFYYFFGTSPQEKLLEREDFNEFRVDYVVGDVQFKRQSDWVTVKNGFSLLPSDSIRTGLAAQLTLTASHKTLRVSENSLLRISDIAE